MRNRAFWRAAHSLAHPVSLAAIVLSLFNDHWLRLEYPSWLTGKLGDWVWLMFAPSIAALIFAWLIPRRLPRQEHIVGIIAFAFIGCWFALAKTVPLVHYLTTTTLDAIVGWEGTLRLDPTDLITLPALIPAWLIWQQAKNTEPELSPRVWVMLVLGVMSTLATSQPVPIPLDHGIVSLCQQGGKLYALNNDEYDRNIYTATNGGLTWQSLNSRPDLDNCQPNNQSNQLDPSINYHFIPGTGVFRSEEDGKTRVLEIDLSETRNEARQLYYTRYRWDPSCDNSREYKPGPHDALIDPKTGNLIVAMGLEGVLIRSPQGEWQRVRVGCYHPIDMSQVQGIIKLIEPELIIAFTLLMLLPGYIVLWVKTVGTNTGCILVGARLSGLAIMLIGRLIHYPDRGFLVVSALVMIVAGLYLIYGVTGKYGFHKRSVLPFSMIAVLSIGITLLYLLPYLMWMRGTIGDHGIATNFALMLVLSSVFGANQYIGRRFPPGKKKKIDELFLPEE